MIDKDNHWIPDDPAEAHLGGNTVGGNPQTYYPQLWQWMIYKLPVKTMLDVGCGEGQALRYFASYGCQVEGMDGLLRNTNIAHAHRHDLTKGPFISGDWKFDLAWCCEVVGQIEERYVPNIMKTLARAEYIALTHQLPAQVGYHIVNGQIHQYWAGAMAAFGYQIDRALTAESKQYGHHYWNESGSIYRRVS
jgi:SAM-dependent methyltransferase